MNIKILVSYVSQKKWTDNDSEVECTVEATIDGVKKKAIFLCVDPLTASEICQKMPEKFIWNDHKE